MYNVERWRESIFCIYQTCPQGSISSQQNMSNGHIYLMKNRIESIIPRMYTFSFLHELQDMFDTARLRIWIDDISLTEDNIAEK